jgi:hypothetical protein
MTTYQRGDGWVLDGVVQSLDQQQIDALQDLLKKQENYSNDNHQAAVGLGTPLYQLLLSYISQVSSVGDQLILEPLPGVDPAVFNWISNAVSINHQDGFAADFIAQYTIDQKFLRDGPTATVQGLSVVAGAQKASNEIAFNVIQDILDNRGTLPGIEGLGVQDAGAAASTVFEDQQYEAGDYAGWAGTLLFPYLGEPQYYVNWLLNAEPFTGTDPNGKTITFKNTPGTYDLVTALDAFETSSISAAFGGVSNLFTAAVSFVAGPAGATANPSALTQDTNKFFQAYYSLSASSEFLPGSDLPFAQGILHSLGNFFSVHFATQYVVGTLASDSDLQGSDTFLQFLKPSIIVGGPNSDVIHGTVTGDDLIDGGGGNNTIYAGGGNDIIFGGSNNGYNVIYGSSTNTSSRDVLISGGGSAAAANAIGGNPSTGIRPRPATTP